MGKKYIIELESGTHIFVLGPEGIVHIGEPDVVYEIVDGMQIGDAVINAKPYTEPDLEQVRKEAYKDGYNSACKVIDVESKTNTAYQKGLSDAWEAVKKLARMDTDTSESITGYFGLHNIMHNLTASEVIEEIRAYEQAQKEKEEQIQVGDEVINRNKTAVVTEITDRYVRIMYSDGSGYALFSKGIVKTGRRFPEIVAVLEKMREESNG